MAQGTADAAVRARAVAAIIAWSVLHESDDR